MLINNKIRINNYCQEGVPDNAGNVETTGV